VPTLPLDAKEARLLIEAAAQADLHAGAGRDFWYEVEGTAGTLAEGLRVDSDDSGVTFVDDRAGENVHTTVAWDDIERISVTGYS
jgi:hypothetical protein